MKRKKNPKADITKNSWIYFMLGLCFVLGLAWQTIEFSTHDGSESIALAINADDDLLEDVPMTQHLKAPPPPPPPPPPAPEKIEIVEDDKEVEEAVIETTETDAEEIIEVEEMEVEEEEVDVDVNFKIIEDKPMFPACAKQPKNKQAECFKKNLDKHVRKTFKYPEISKEMGVQGKVYVFFRIRKDGVVEVINSRSNDKNLDKEARRIINKLPKLIPGKQRGRPTSVTFAYPIIFRLQ